MRNVMKRISQFMSFFRFLVYEICMVNFMINICSEFIRDLDEPRMLLD